jgi:hypothetical protein
VCELERRWNGTFAEEALARAEGNREDLEPQFIHQVMLEERLKKLAATVHVKIGAVLLLQSPYFFHDVIFDQDSVVPKRICASVRNNILRRSIDARPPAFVCRPI